MQDLVKQRTKMLLQVPSKPSRKTVFVAPIREVWKGPFVMVRKISEILYQIKGHPETNKNKIIHHDRIRRFKCNSIPLWVLPLQQDVNSGNTFVDHTVTKVIRKRKVKSSKSVKNNQKINRRQSLCNDAELITGKRKLNPPKRYQP